MIQLRTILLAADNAGAVTFKCIRLFGGNLQKYVSIGHYIKSVPKRLRRFSVKIDPKIRAKKVQKWEWKPITAFQRIDRIKDKKLLKKRGKGALSIKQKKKLRLAKRKRAKYLNIIISIKKKFKRHNGLFFQFMQNKVVSIGGQHIFLKKATPSFPFLGTRLRSPITRELFKTKKLKLRNQNVILKTRMYI